MGSQSDRKRSCLVYLGLFLLAASLTVAAGAQSSTDRLTPDDARAIKATIGAYRTAWLANNSQGVLKTFTADAVLLPAHGFPAIVGIAAIEKYWFTPGGPPTTIT